MRYRDARKRGIDPRVWRYRFASPVTALFLAFWGAKRYFSRKSGTTCLATVIIYDFSRATTAERMISTVRASTTAGVVLAEPITFLRTGASTRSATPSRLQVHATADPRAIRRGVAVVADVPTFAPAYRRTIFRYGHARVAVCCRSYLRYTYLSTFDFRPPLIRSVATADSPANDRRARLLRGCRKCSSKRR